MGVFARYGVVGALQAMEAIKLLAQIGASLNGRLLLLAPKRRLAQRQVAKDPAASLSRAGSGAGR